MWEIWSTTIDVMQLESEKKLGKRQFCLFSCRGRVLSGWEWSGCHLCHAAGWFPGRWPGAVQGGAELRIQHPSGVLQVRNQVPGELHYTAEMTSGRWCHHLNENTLDLCFLTTTRGFKILSELSGWIAMEFGSDMHFPFSINCCNFGDPLTFQ